MHVIYDTVIKEKINKSLREIYENTSNGRKRIKQFNI